MNPIEQAIRNALAKGDQADPVFRKRVYSSAGAAMERSLRARGLPQADIATRRAHIASVIAGVEASYGVQPGQAEPYQQPSNQAQDYHVQEPYQQNQNANDDALSPLEAMVSTPRADERLGGSDRSNAAREGHVASQDGGLDHVPMEAKSIRKRRGPFAILLGIVIVVVALLMMVLWIVSTGLFAPADPDSGAVPNPRNEEPENYSGTAPPKLGEANVDDDRNWINVFSSADPSGVQISEGAKASLVTLNGISGVQISGGGNDQKIGFPVGQGVLQSLSGKQAVFDVIARTVDGDTGVPISLTCSFAELGDCVRKRYEIGLEFSEYLFSVDLPNSNPSSGGWIYIEPDLDGQGRSIMIERIRVAAE